ncbi:hypothetical protein [Pseudalkalibacillus berkeleyi]|uniref:Uncharacterized protein n=1 Tax=Pseudalkalibacillus berkeleyi TaxID=1069813 RepID=A0ABS9H2Z4_9BACL|nr:hypothetical protein [Pseudalkalibacillus berkeleyi]MCF6139254.1 hypothetical protein [Pseudalkalibacillus berkeleyi]
MRLVKHLNDFQHIKRQGTGYFIVLGHNHNKIHSVQCAWIKEESFMQKVITNNGKNSSYYWVQFWNSTQSTFNEKPCQKCMS